jgi:hypothetical protein
MIFSPFLLRKTVENVFDQFFFYPEKCLRLQFIRSYRQNVIQPPHTYQILYNNYKPLIIADVSERCYFYFLTYFAMWPMY